MESLKKFRIKYKIVLEKETIENKEIKVDNCMSDLHAKIKLEDYLKRKYIGFKGLIVESCKEIYFDSFDEILNSNKNLFGGKDKNLGDLGSIFGNIFK